MRRRFVLIPIFALALGSAFASAQTSGGAAAGAKPNAPKAAAVTSAPNSSWERTHRASKIIGMDVVNRQGEKVGDIEDIVLDRNGSIAYAVVSTGAFLGVGDRLHAVPWRSLQMSTGADHFVLDLDKERLSKAPGFDSNTFPDMNDAKWSAENRKHFPVASTSTRSSSSSQTTGSDASASRAGRNGVDAGPGKRAGTDGPTSDMRSPSTSGRGSGNDVGITTSTSRRSGTAAGSGSSATSDAGAASANTSGSGGSMEATPGNERTQPGGAASGVTGNATTNQSGTAGGTGNPAATGGGSK